jgi:hypothetical protein
VNITGPVKFQLPTKAVIPWLTSHNFSAGGPTSFYRGLTLNSLKLFPELMVPRRIGCGQMMPMGI